MHGYTKIKTISNCFLYQHSYEDNGLKNAVK